MKDLFNKDGLLRRSAFRPTVAVGAVPGHLFANEGSVAGRIRVIRYDPKNHLDDFIDSVAELTNLVESQPIPTAKPVANFESCTSRCGVEKTMA